MPNLRGHDAELAGQLGQLRELTTPAETLIQISIPPGTPLEAEVAITRLVELTTILAKRAGQLQQALDTRIVIEQAKGILAERHRISVDDAFRVLRHGARSGRIRLHDLAERVVETSTTPPEIRIPESVQHRRL